ncbi:MAG: DinB family protein [Gemmatimonadota bacterium]|nr:DinB family protein [Gemmatimonadota bacterium]
MSASAAPGVIVTPAELHEHWQGHRRLTRRVIEAFPADQINTFSLGGMRPFGAMVRELLNMAEPSLQGALTDEWRSFTEGELGKAELLERWDESTRRIDELFPQLPDARFRETRNAFGMWEGTVWNLLFYVIDNEVHHRAQGYVYLRALDIDVPPFWERQ